MFELLNWKLKLLWKIVKIWKIFGKFSVLTPCKQLKSFEFATTFIRILFFIHSNYMWKFHVIRTILKGVLYEKKNELKRPLVYFSKCGFCCFLVVTWNPSKIQKKNSFNKVPSVYVHVPIFHYHFHQNLDHFSCTCSKCLFVKNETSS